MLGCGLVALGTSSFALGMSVVLCMCGVGVSVVSRWLCRVTTCGIRDEWY